MTFGPQCAEALALRWRHIVDAAWAARQDTPEA